MLQPNHRGIYEYLWSEHKFVALSVSIKAFQTTAGKLGKLPQILTLLRRLQNHSTSEKPCFMDGLLNAYMQLKRHLNRRQRYELIETLLSSQKKGAELIYTQANKFKESTLYGCRLFFPIGKAVYKFWDAQDHPGLWCCFGPFQMHLNPQEVFNRVAQKTGMDAAEMRNLLKSLSTGLSIDNYQNISENIRSSLEHNNLVAKPGLSAYLHPRARTLLACSQETHKKYDLFSLAALALEKVWDEQPETISQLPEFSVFKNFFNREALSEYCWNDNYRAEEGFEFLANVFYDQKHYEQGKGRIYQLDSSVGMEAGDEKVYPEKSKHGNDEPEN
ncbi:MAG: hypothetical protein Kow0029_25400 [Candidatus Rifleibacteriota bacterium]